MGNNNLIRREMKAVIEPYMAIGIQSTFYDIFKRADIKRNLAHLSQMIDAAVYASSLELPVKLVVLAEGAIQGFGDEWRNVDQAEYTRECIIDIPGKETDRLGEKAKKHQIYIVGQNKAKIPEFPDRYFNTCFILNPEGKVIYTHRKNVVFVREHSTTPHDVYDEWIKLHGDTLDAFFPVARTDIGNIAATCCMEGSFPETFRGFALNGAEIICRPSYPEPWLSGEQYEVQNRARALDNACYVIAPSCGHYYRDDKGSKGSILEGRSMIVDYRGTLIAHSYASSDTFVAAPVNIEQLRYHRTHARFLNWLPYLKTEIYRKIYEQPIWPKNLPTMKHKQADEVFFKVVNELQERGAFTPYQ